MVRNYQLRPLGGRCHPGPDPELHQSTQTLQIRQPIKTHQLLRAGAIVDPALKVGVGLSQSTHTLQIRQPIKTMGGRYHPGPSPQGRCRLEPINTHLTDQATSPNSPSTGGRCHPGPSPQGRCRLARACCGRAARCTGRTTTSAAPAARCIPRSAASTQGSGCRPPRCG